MEKENPYVSFDLFSQYMSFHDTDRGALAFLYLNAAQEVIEKYIGYQLEEKDYQHRVKGLNSPRLALHAFPVKNIVFDRADITLIDVKKNIATINRAIEKNITVEVSYTAGYTAETIPHIIKLTIMRIAALMVSEESGDIAITGKNFGEDGGRTFISTRDYSRLLKELESYRIY